MPNWFGGPYQTSLNPDGSNPYASDSDLTPPPRDLIAETINSDWAAKLHDVVDDAAPYVGEATGAVYAWGAGQLTDGDEDAMQFVHDKISGFVESGWHDVADLPSNLYFGVDQTAPSSPADSGSGYDYSGSDFGSSDSSDAGGDF
ncbi:hypothetical protein [Paracoccus sp. (in: a-proteobacteria)]|uniref:hypothetical protein n=1 Tax=Paracoccus sp. TaxID=267 RepID=UPI00321FE458